MKLKILSICYGADEDKWYPWQVTYQWDQQLQLSHPFANQDQDQSLSYDLQGVPLINHVDCF